MSETRRRMLDQIEEAEQARDWRSEEQKLADAVARHLANIGLHICLASDSAPRNAFEAANALEAARASAIRAFDDSQAELYRRVEDLCLIDPRKLGKAREFIDLMESGCQKLAGDKVMYGPGIKPRRHAKKAAGFGRRARD